MSDENQIGIDALQVFLVLLLLVMIQLHYTVPRFMNHMLVTTLVKGSRSLIILVVLAAAVEIEVYLVIFAI